MAFSSGCGWGSISVGSDTGEESTSGDATSGTSATSIGTDDGITFRSGCSGSLGLFWGSSPLILSLIGGRRDRPSEFKLKFQITELHSYVRVTHPPQACALRPARLPCHQEIYKQHRAEITLWMHR